MKLTGAAAAGFFKAPDASLAAILIFGADPMRVADKRQATILALIGPDGETDMRLTRIPASDLRKEPARLNDALKAVGFFPGHRVVFVEDATDALTQMIADGMADWQPGDAQLIVTAGQLTARSALRKWAEGHPKGVSIGLYDDPPSRGEVEQLLTASGIPRPEADATEALFALSATLEPGDFRQTLEKLALYKLGDPSPVSVEEVAANAPQSAEVDIDDFLDTVAQGHVEKIGPMLANLAAQGVAPVTLCIGAVRYFRRVHTAACDAVGAAAGAGKLRPPVFGPRRDRLVRIASTWGRDRLERALTALTDIDLTLRSKSNAPAMASLERTLIRLAMMARR